jgi:NADH-quinone oxidoreductase subunit G
MQLQLIQSLANKQFLLHGVELLDNGSLQDGEANLAGTARKTVAVISPKRADAIGVKDGDLVKVSNSNGAVVLPVLIEAIHDDAVWAPRNSAGSELLRTLGVASNSVVTVVKA